MRDPRAIIKRMQITEKGTAMQEKQGKYLFRVDMSANKPEIKRAVEKLFNVQVSKVNVMRCLGKKRRQRTAQYGKTPDWKRAIVTLKAGSKIELA